MKTIEHLLSRGVPLAESAANALLLVAHGREIDPSELIRYAQELRGWTADLRAVLGEDRP